MSIRCSMWAWKQPITNAKHKLVLLKLADSANDDGVAWPSMRTMSSDTGISKSALSRITREMEKQGLFRIQETVKHDGRKGVHVYHLSVDGVSHSDVNAASHPGRDAEPSEEPTTSTKPLADASRRAAAESPTSTGDHRWQVPSPRRPAGFAVNLAADPPTCTCENRGATKCRHIKAAEVAEERAEKARRRELRSAVWDVLVDLFDPPRRTPAQKRIIGETVQIALESMARAEVEEKPEVLSAEVRRRHGALMREWGPGRVTLKSFMQNVGLAGKLAEGELPFPNAPRSGGLSAEEMARQAMDDEAAGL